MSLIARSRQVICVTHLPQIAAMADHEFLVEKHEEGGRTNTSVHLLTDEERIHEVGRMISGTDGTDTSAQAHAAHMLSSAANFRAVRDGIAPQSTN
jgi:DNA repair protein RecN (Recombination protein N)